MDYLSKHVFDYLTFTGGPDDGQLHKPKAAAAGADLSTTWAPKRCRDAGRITAAGMRTRRPGLALAMRDNRSRSQPAVSQRSKKWGDKHYEVKPEKMAHDAWLKFLTLEEEEGRMFSGDDGKQPIFTVPAEFVPEILKQMPSEKPDEPEPLQRKISQFSALFFAPIKITPELLIILTFAPATKFFTVSIKEAKNLPYNCEPYARLLVFDGTKLIKNRETKRTKAVHFDPTHRDRRFNEAFVVSALPSSIRNIHVIIEMYDKPPIRNLSSYRPVGAVTLGAGGWGNGAEHWHQMFSKPGSPICMWHKLELQGSDYSKVSSSMPSIQQHTSGSTRR